MTRRARAKWISAPRSSSCTTAIWSDRTRRLQKTADVDRAGVTVAAIKGQSQQLFVSRHLKNARVRVLDAMPPQSELESMLLEERRRVRDQSPAWAGRAGGLGRQAASARRQLSRRRSVLRRRPTRRCLESSCQDGTSDGWYFENDGPSSVPADQTPTTIDVISSLVRHRQNVVTIRLRLVNLRRAGTQETNLSLRAPGRGLFGVEVESSVGATKPRRGACVLRTRMG